MVEIVWEFVVKEGTQGQFELVFGPGGAWSRLFARVPGFRGTTVLRDARNPRRYLVIDLWETEAQREQALTSHQVECASLEAAFADWSESRSELGVFSLRAEATVRPLGKSSPSSSTAGKRRPRG